MKRFFIIIFSIILTVILLTNYGNYNLTKNKVLSTEEWIEDIDFFSDSIKKVIQIHLCIYLKKNGIQI